MFHTIIIAGNLGKDPEMRYTPSGQAVTASRLLRAEIHISNGEQVKKRFGSAFQLGANKRKFATNI